MMEKKVMAKLNEVNKKGEAIAELLKNKLGADVKVSCSEEEIIFDLFVTDNRYDYFKITVLYDKSKKVYEYLREILEAIEDEDYYYYQSSKMEKELIDFLESVKADNVHIYEEDLWIDGYDPINLTDIEKYELDTDDKTIYLVWEDEEALITIGNIFEPSIVEWFEPFEYEPKCKKCEKLEQEIQELNELIEELRCDISSLRRDKRALQERLKNKDEIIGQMLKDIMNN